MRTLVVPDVHGQIAKLDRVIELIKEADRAVFLADFTDSFDDYDPIELLRRVTVLCEDPKVTILWSNHDCHYAFKHPWFRCSGYNPKTQVAWNRLMPPVLTNEWKIWTQVDGFTVSHAGFHPDTLHLHTPAKHAEALQMARDGQFHEMWMPGYEVGGPAGKVGGPTWLRWSRFAPIAGMQQIVGHTPGSKVRVDWLDFGSEPSYCLDTHLQHVAWVQDNVVEIAKL